MGGKWTAQVNVKWNKKGHTWDWSKQWPTQWNEVRWAGSTMGDWDMVLWIDVDSPEKLEDFVQTKLWGQDWVADTKSTWVKEVWAA